MAWTIYTSAQLSNEEYQAHPAVSGSELATIYKKSPAHYKHGEKKESKVLTFGIAAHAMLLEPDAFDSEFVRDIDADQYPDALITQKDMQAWLKKRGMKASGIKPELMARILEAAPETHIFDDIKAKHEQANEGKIIVPPADFDKIQMMRGVIMQDDQMATMLKSGYAECSLIGKLAGVDVKVRPDLITSGGGIVQYKTTQSCHPVDFERAAYNYGYFLKAALEWHSFTQCYGHEPAYYVFLAQEKEAPYVWKPWMLGKDHKAIGTIQLESALKVYESCIERNEYPAYGQTVESLPVPEYRKREYNL